MNLRSLHKITLLAVFLFWATMTEALDGKSVARLKRAGISDATIEWIITERTIETAAFSVDDILALKAAGIDEKALQTLIREGSFLKDRDPIVYGRDLRPLRLTTAADIIELKQAGVSDEVLQAIVAVGGGDASIERHEALRLLDEMGIWVDQRDESQRSRLPVPRRR